MFCHSGRKGDYTFEEFLDLSPEGEKADLLNGAIYIASPDNTDTGELLAWLIVVVRGFVEVRGLGRIYACRVAYRISSKHGPEPDLSFLPKESESRRRRAYIKGPPALAVEIVSPDSVEPDYVLKRAIYEEAGVREYWIIDPDEERVTFLVLRRGKYQEAAPVRHVFTSTVLPGFSLDVRWLRNGPRPRAYDVLQRLLARQ